ncbi:MAG: hypothetical protein H6741_10095 [Alphaproteobacteria bacterium]|nr:hypothetical protein [Alphaproteobacteria bacterium]
MSAVLSPPLADRRLSVGLIAMFLLTGLSMAGAVGARSGGDEAGPGCGAGAAIAAGGGLIGVRAVSKLGREGAEVAVKQSDNLLRHADDVAVGASHVDAGTLNRVGDAAVEAGVDVGARALNSDEVSHLLIEEGPGLLLDVAAYVIDEGGNADSGNGAPGEVLLDWTDGMPGRIAWCRIEGDQIVTRVFAKEPHTLVAFATEEGAPMVDLENPKEGQLVTAPVSGPGNVTVPRPPGGDQVIVVLVQKNEAGRLRLTSAPVQAKPPRNKGGGDLRK